MSRLPLRHRIVGALRLQPMSIASTARCLSVTQQVAQKGIHRLSEKGLIRPIGFEPRKYGKSPVLWSVSSGLLQAQNRSEP